jgi:hypothetical protein
MEASMKRCQFKGTRIFVLVLASLFILISCGIPTYFYLDDSEVTWQSVPDTENNQFTLTVTLNPSALAKISEKGVDAGPGLKFFYALSNSASTYLLDSITQITTVSSRFNTNFKGAAGNGIPWTPGYESAPGFYLYTNDSGTQNTFSLERPDTGSDGLVIGTFSISETTIDEYEFRKAPEMDISLENGNSPIKLTIKRGEDSPDGYTDLLVELVLQVPGNLDFRTYSNGRFPTNSATLAEVVAEDTEFLKYLLKGSQYLYVHIWASLFCGEGDFSNIYWSNLKYLGYIELYSLTE